MHDPKSIKIIAHRGVSGIAPENTLKAFSLAASIEADYIEMDLRLSKDGIPVVLHDSSLKRTTGMKKLIHTLSLSEIKKLDAGKWFDETYAGEQVPTLEQVLMTVGQSTGLMLEIKHCPQPPDMVVDAIFRTLKNFELSLPPLIIGSFSLSIIEKIKQHAAKFPKKIKTIGILEKHNMIAPMINHGVDILAVWHKILTPGLVQTIISHGLPTWAFTVDDVALARFLASIGVRGIISNFPQRLHDLE